MQSAEIEQDCASRDTQRQTGGRSLQPRLVWTPELDQRFVEAVEQLGLETATPKTIMQVFSNPFPLLSLPSSYTQQHFTGPPTKQENAYHKAFLDSYTVV